MEQKKKRFIGVWDYTVILTFLGFCAGIAGIVFALVHLEFSKTKEINEDVGFYISLGCLMFAGLCDSFDGIVARTKKNRTINEKRFGIQLDSLSDLVCFGVLPALIGYRIGLKSAWWIFLLVFYCLMALVRLAFFNVEEIEKDVNSTVKNINDNLVAEGKLNDADIEVKESEEKRTFYYGLPVTNVSWILPIVCCFKPLLGSYFGYLYAVALAVIGFLFVYKFKMKKLKANQILIFVVAMTVVFTFILVLGIKLDLDW